MIPTSAMKRIKEEDEEGCLSVPEVWAPVRRPETVMVNAYDLSGTETNEEISGMFARIVQHELDHLNGTLFIDRLTPSARASINDKLADFELEFQRGQERGHIPPAADILARLEELERERT